MIENGFLFLWSFRNRNLYYQKTETSKMSRKLIHLCCNPQPIPQKSRQYINKQGDDLFHVSSLQKLNENHLGDTDTYGHPQRREREAGSQRQVARELKVLGKTWFSINQLSSREPSCVQSSVGSIGSRIDCVAVELQILSMAERSHYRSSRKYQQKVPVCPRGEPSIFSRELCII